MNLNVLVLFFSTLLLVTVSERVLAAPDLNAPGAWSVTWENDLFSPKHQDRHYTNGLQVTKTSDNLKQFDSSNTFSWLANATKSLPAGAADQWSTRRTTLSLGQIMQTPEDITIEPPDSEDTPYGGILYLGHGLEVFSENHADYFDLLIGVTGKYSLAEQSQSFIHGLTGSTQPQGWDHQIPSSLLLNAYYSRRGFRPLVSTQNNWQFDALAYGHIAVGNIQTDLLASAGFSLHQKAINSLGIRPGRLARGVIMPARSEGRGWYFYTGVSVKAVAWDVLLDGAMFRDSPSVDKKTLVGQFITNTGYKWKKFSLHYSWVVSTPTYDRERGGPDHYGSLNISWRL